MLWLSLLIAFVAAPGLALARKATAVFDAFMEGDLDENADWLERRRRTQLLVFLRLEVSEARAA